MASLLPFFPASGGGARYLTRQTGRGDNRVSKWEPMDQARRHTENFVSLFKVSENTATFLPNEYGVYEKPIFLDFIKNTRHFVGVLNRMKGGVYRKSSLFEVQTPECAHGLGSADIATKCKNAVLVTTFYLDFRLHEHTLLSQELRDLAVLYLATLLYLHDCKEDAVKFAKKLPESHPQKEFFKNITTLYIAEQALKDSPVPHAEKLVPILAEALETFTDNAKYEKRDRDARIAAQKIPPHQESLLLQSLGIIGDDPWFYGPITIGKYSDKMQQNTTDLLILATGHKSIHKSINALIDFFDPRIEFINSLHIPNDFKDLFYEQVEIMIQIMRNPLNKPLHRDVASEHIIHPILTRNGAIFSGRQPFKPLCATRRFDFGRGLLAPAPGPL